MIPAPWDTLWNLLYLVCVAFGFYHLGVAVAMHRGTKEILELERRIDFQLRAKGYEGLGLTEEEKRR